MSESRWSCLSWKWMVQAPRVSERDWRWRASAAPSTSRSSSSRSTPLLARRQGFALVRHTQPLPGSMVRQVSHHATTTDDFYLVLRSRHRRAQERELASRRQAQRQLGAVLQGQLHRGHAEKQDAPKVRKLGIRINWQFSLCGHAAWAPRGCLCRVSGQAPGLPGGDRAGHGS